VVIIRYSTEVWKGIPSCSYSLLLASRHLRTFAATPASPVPSKIIGAPLIHQVLSAPLNTGVMR